MALDLSIILSFLGENSYLFLFLILLVETRITVIIAGLLVSYGYFSLLGVLLLSILADFIRDNILFFLGRLEKSNLVQKFIRKFNLKKNYLKKLRKTIEKNPLKGLSIIKITPSITMVGIFFTGTTKISTKYFLSHIIMITVVLKITYLLVGYFSGSTINYIINYVDTVQYTIVFIVLFLVLVIYGFNKIHKYVGKNIRKN